VKKYNKTARTLAGYGVSLRGGSESDRRTLTGLDPMQQCEPERATLNEMIHAYYLAQDVDFAFESIFEAISEIEREELITGPHKRLWLALKALNDL
jgi:hypothetical protein